MASFFPECVEDIVRMYAGQQEFVIVHDGVEFVVHASTADAMKEFKLKTMASIPGLSSSEVAYHRFFLPIRRRLHGVEWATTMWPLLKFVVSSLLSHGSCISCQIVQPSVKFSVITVLLSI